MFLIMSKNRLFNKVMGVATGITILGLQVTCINQNKEINNLKHENIVQANKIENRRLQVGTKYNLDNNFSMIVSEYNYKGKKNIVVATNLKHKNYYSVGANEDKKHRTNGVTIAFGSDEK